MLLWVPVGDDRTQLAAVGIRDPQHDPWRIEHRRSAREDRGQRKRIHDPREIRAERRDPGQVDGWRSRGCRHLIHGLHDDGGC